MFVASMPDKFDEFIKSAIEKKKVPVTVVNNREQADFEITGFSETQKAGAAKKIIMGSWHSREIGKRQGGESKIRGHCLCLFLQQRQFCAWQENQCRIVCQASEREDRKRKVIKRRAAV